MATVAQIMVHSEAVFVAVVLFGGNNRSGFGSGSTNNSRSFNNGFTPRSSTPSMARSVVTVAAIRLITAVRSTVEAVPLAEAAMVPAVPLEEALPVARAIMAAAHSEAEDS